MTSAFTLAEVLITLAIIGIVAALTIPTLITNYQKKMYITKIQKAHSVLINGFKLMTASEGVDYLEQTQFMKDIEFTESNANPDSLVKSIKKNLSKYFKITDACYGSTEDSCPLYKISYSSLNGGEDLKLTDTPYFQIQDGTIFWILSSVKEFLMIGVDINGESGPNILGRDFHLQYVISDYRFLTLSDTPKKDSTMKILTYMQYVGENGKYSDIPEADQAAYCGSLGSKNVSQAEGTFCIDRIIEEGWKMNY